MKKPHLLYFPCHKAIYDWFGESAASEVPPVTVDLLAEQHEFERQPSNRESRITCHSCGNPEARYVVCRLHGQRTDKLYPRRYPRSQRCHKPGCASYAEELKPADIDVSGNLSPTVRPGGDFAALRRELSDPEYSVVAMRRPNRAHVASSHGGSGRGTGRLTIGLQRLARALLQRSGVCEWHPQFIATRNERVFNGKIKGALEALAFESGPASDVLASLPSVSFVPWSYLQPCILCGHVQTRGCRRTLRYLSCCKRRVISSLTPPWMKSKIRLFCGQRFVREMSCGIRGLV